MTRRDDLADAAVGVLADEGLRRLTHRAVDARAGLPQGSTSNVFRTRAALIDGILARLVERERAALDAAGPAIGPVTEQGLVQLAAAMVQDALGPGRAQTQARRALFAGAAQHPQVAAQLEQATRFWWTLIGRLLAAVGAPDPDRRARWLLAYVDGVISDQLARPDADFDARAALAPAVHGIVRLP